MYGNGYYYNAEFVDVGLLHKFTDIFLIFKLNAWKIFTRKLVQMGIDAGLAE
jgi:hypothetical protein